MSEAMITEQEAQRIVDGIQTGSLDALDLLGIVDHYEEWVRESWSYTALLIREDRAMTDAAIAEGVTTESEALVKGEMP